MPTERELVEAAWSMVPTLKERAQSCEDAGRVPKQTIVDFERAGFYRIAQPRAFGGYEMSPEVLFTVAMVLARGCPSSAWCLCLIGVHNWEPGLMDEQAAEDLWADDQTVRYSSSYAPVGQIEVVEGGYRLSGHWEWSSGSNHCSWVMLGAMLPDADPESERPPMQIGLLLPSEEYQIVENWHVAGLKGTGSHDIVVNDAFVPEHRTHLLTASSKQAFGRGIYDLPFGNVFGLCLCAVTQGIAEGALESYQSYLMQRVHKYDGQAMAVDPFQQRRLSEAVVDIEANRARFHSIFRRLEAELEEAVTVPPARQIKENWELQSIAHRNADIVTTLMRASGGGAQRAGHSMQRYFRDINAAVAHAFLGIDRGSLQFSRSLLKSE